MSTFLQTAPFYSGRDLYLLIPRDSKMSNLAKLFICTVIQFNKYKYNYGRQANKTLPSLILKLPIDKEGKLDYLWNHILDHYHTEIDFHHCNSITSDTTMILKIYKTTENRHKKAQKQKQKDTNIKIKKQICYGNY